MKAPDRIDTTRLVLRKPTASDADAIFTRYAADAEVTRYLSWPRHRSIEDTKQFLIFSEAEWERWPAGPYLIQLKHNDQLLGGTGLAFESPEYAITGYVLARDSWGKGYATEALTAIIEVARNLGVTRLSALCHPDHGASIHVLQKCGFVLEDRLPAPTEFPNLRPGHPEDCLRYLYVLD